MGPEQGAWPDQARGEQPEVDQAATQAIEPFALDPAHRFGHTRLAGLRQQREAGQGLRSIGRRAIGRRAIGRRARSRLARNHRMGQDAVVPQKIARNRLAKPSVFDPDGGADHCSVHVTGLIHRRIGEFQSP